MYERCAKISTTEMIVVWWDEKPLNDSYFSISILCVIDNTNLAIVFLPTSLVIIADYAFHYCNLKSITIPTLERYNTWQSNPISPNLTYEPIL